MVIIVSIGIVCLTVIAVVKMYYKYIYGECDTCQYRLEQEGKGLCKQCGETYYIDKRREGKCNL